MGEPGQKNVKIKDEVIEVPDTKEGEGDDVHAEVCIQPGRNREDSGFSTGEDEKLSEMEDKLYRRCFDKVIFSTLPKSTTIPFIS